MQEILPGIFHWTARHPKIRIEVSSYYLPGLAGGGVLIDPLVPAEGIAWFRAQGPPSQVLLTNRHHYRHSARFVEAYGTSVWCHRAGLHEFTKAEAVEPFEHGQELPGGILAFEVGVLCPEETALYIPRTFAAGRASPTGKASGARATGTRGGAPEAGRATGAKWAAGRRGGVLAFGDALIRGPDGALGFVPDEYMGEDPEGVKRGLRKALRRLLKGDFSHLLLAHGAPQVRGAKATLRRFLETRRG